METFYRTHHYLVEHVQAPVRRILMDEINWQDRLIGIKGTRGIGKTTFLLQYAKEKFGSDRSCLYINMNNFYFANHTLSDFAQQFVDNGGKVLLIDQVFKYPAWSQELRICYDRFPNLRIIFTNSSVMQLEDYPELASVCKLYHLRGFSFREFLNLKTGHSFHPYSLGEILENHQAIAETVLRNCNPLDYFKDYLHHGFYPFFLEHRNYSENLLKTMNMMIEVDILLIKQIELKYLSKIKKLLYLLAVDGTVAPNVSQLAKEIQTSRATIMNYIKYLSEARLINMIYPSGESFPKKPAKLMMHNTNLMYAIYPIKFEKQDVLDTFLTNALHKGHQVCKGERGASFLIDDKYHFRTCMDIGDIRNNPRTYMAVRNMEVGHGNEIPLWLMGFLY